MRIVIDMQGAQSTGSRNRGIGRYTLSLSKAIVRNQGGHEVILALNGLFPESIETIRADFNDLLPQESIRVWYVPEVVNSLSAENDGRRQSAELVREAFIASLDPDIVLVTSLFEGLNDDAVTSIGALSGNVPTAAVLYDLIPLIYRVPYLENPVIEAWYQNKLDHLRRADLLLAISESSRQEGMEYLGFHEETIVNISTAADPHFQPQTVSSQLEAEIRERYKLRHSYVMYTGGIDLRKNIEGLIRAYASLPKELRAQHQLAVVCSIQQNDRIRLEEQAKNLQLNKDELVLTGFVPEDDLLTLYALCKLFVFPSWHEGFGLPVLEAMSCGRAVIGSNISSVPEVIGLKDALFNPKNDESISVKLAQVLTDDAFREELERHGLEQAGKFSWDRSAIRAIAAFEQYHKTHQQRIETEHRLTRRPKMAYISPLPPQRSGISDYSVELLPELSQHYDIDVIVEQDFVLDSWVNVNTQIRDVNWFRSHANHYDRVLYHFGNSHFHQYMFSLLGEIPGVVVLHDFFLSGIVAYMDSHGSGSNGWACELYKAYGYNSMQERYHAADQASVIYKYPCNMSVLREAQGVIVHSENSRRLAKHWYATNDAKHWSVIPHLRTPVFEHDCTKAREILQLNEDDFVICSFGLLGPSKLNHRLLDAWIASQLSKDKRCILVFVGENDKGKYGQDLRATIQHSSLSKQVHITGWVDTENFRHYLAAADIGVQLRALSRGETSGTVLDCMNYGLPTIVNANGSMVDLEDNSVWKLSDEFSNEQVVIAIETLWNDKQRRMQLGKCARDIIVKNHAPRSCAKQYYTAIEGFYRNAATDIHSLVNAISKVDLAIDGSEECFQLAKSVAKSINPRFFSRQLFVDVSGLVKRGSKNNIRPGTKKLLLELLTHCSNDLRIEPVYAEKDNEYRYARNYTLQLLGCPANILNDELIEYQAGDIFLGLDIQPVIVEVQHSFYQQMRRHGVNVHFVVYDQSIDAMSQYFVESTAEGHNRWFKVVAENDGVMCFSKAVANGLDVWIKKHGNKRARPFKISRLDLSGDSVSTSIFENVNMILKSIRG